MHTEHHCLIYIQRDKRIRCYNGKTFHHLHKKIYVNAYVKETTSYWIFFSFMYRYVNVYKPKIFPDEFFEFAWLSSATFSVLYLTFIIADFDQGFQRKSCISFAQKLATFIILSLSNTPGYIMCLDASVFIEKF